jgi:UDP-2,3-diacylglucosamine pyrophosphatase LpxH
MIIITDAHVSKTRGNHTPFFQMLAAIERTGNNLIFLGDIFDLWIALPRYEEEIHTKFIDWCRKQKHFRTIGYLEGNHEYYLASERARAFTWCSCEGWWRDDADLLFVHGDQINRKDRGYLLFNKLIKNNLTKSIFRYLPYGPEIALSVKHRLKKTNKKFRIQIPWDEIRLFADDRFAEGVDTIFMGHFHQESSLPNHKSKQLHILPDWLSTQKVTVYEKASQKLSTMHWKELS